MREFNDDLRGRRRSRSAWKALVGELTMRIRELEAAEVRWRQRELKKDREIQWLITRQRKMAGVGIFVPAETVVAKPYQRAEKDESEEGSQTGT